MLPRPAYRQFRGVTPMWDNTARRQNEGMVVVDSSPELFGVWLGHAIAQTRLRHRGDERLLFVNAWNEWAEGNHLEPDRRYGRRYLEAVRATRIREFAPSPTRPGFADVERDTASLIASGAISLKHFAGAHAKPSAAEGNDVSLVMPLYNHARYLPRTLASIGAQTLEPRELIVVDDGSSDGGAEIVAEFARRVSFPVTLVSQANAGADTALNRGMAVARGDIVALINSDDAFHPERLERLVAALAPGIDLAFSDVSFIDDDGCGRGYRLCAHAAPPHRRGYRSAESAVSVDRAQHRDFHRQSFVPPSPSPPDRWIRADARLSRLGFLARGDLRYAAGVRRPAGSISTGCTATTHSQR